MKNVKKSVLFALLAGGTMFQGCLGSWFNWMVQGIPGTVFAEWLLDNDGVFDLFPDGGTQ